MWIITIASSCKSSQSVMYYDVHMYYVCWYIVLIIWINDEPSVDKPCIEYISLAHYVVGTCMQVHCVYIQVIFAYIAYGIYHLV